eukprot:SM000006S19485  [mRNA]  locus=s6:1080577:1081787:+ [translate_table: standard]
MADAAGAEPGEEAAAAAAEEGEEGVEEGMEEGVEEEEEFVILELDDRAAQCAPLAGQYLLAGLDTDAPVLTLGDGTQLVGRHEYALGSCMLFDVGQTGSSDRAANGRQDNNCVPLSPPWPRLIGQTQRKIRFSFTDGQKAS